MPQYGFTSDDALSERPAQLIDVSFMQLNGSMGLLLTWIEGSKKPWRVIGMDMCASL